MSFGTDSSDRWSVRRFLQFLSAHRGMTSEASEESSPLEVIDQRSGCYTSNYSTFSSTRQQLRKAGDEVPFWWAPFSCHFQNLSPMKRVHHDSNHSSSWKLVTVLVLCASLGVFHKQSGFLPLDFQGRLEWRWDHNIYIPRHPDDAPKDLSGMSSFQIGGQIDQSYSSSFLQSSSSRNLLLAQVVGGSKLKQLGEISSRPNRAYARQWGRDYAMLWRRFSLTSRSCFDKAIVLNTIMERQIQPYPSHIQYDVLALLGPDSIVTNLDYDLLAMMPNDKLVAIAGWDDPSSASNTSATTITRTTNSRTDVVFFNLRHKYAYAVSRLWWKMVSPRTDVTCGAGNDLQLLILAIQFVMEEEEDLNSLVIGLDESEQGFVGVFTVEVIKGISPMVPSSKAVMLVSNLAETKMTLQTTADSVCYRYYPKCEVLPV